MKKRFTLPLFLFFLSLHAATAGIADNKDAVTFRENKGQITDQYNKPRADVLFAGSAGPLVYHLKKNGISYQLQRFDDAVKNIPEKGLMQKLAANTTLYSSYTLYRVDLTWLGSSQQVEVARGEAVEGYDNYYNEGCPSGILNAKGYQNLEYKNLYPGINLKWYSRNGQLKYDYLVSKGADYKNIKLLINGALSITVNKEGALVIKTPLDDLTEEKPYVEQDGRALNARWKIENNVVSFDITGVNGSRPLVIDPLVRLWGTYYGANGSDQVQNMKIDAANNIYMTGYTLSYTSLNIATVGSYQSSYGGGGSGPILGDAFLVKFDNTGTRLWSTYYGGSGSDWGWGLACDASGNIYLTGGTSTSNTAIMATAGAHQPNYGGATSISGYGDGFITKFTSAGARTWSTYYGGAFDDYFFDCTLDLQGNLYACGSSTSPDAGVIASPGAHQAGFTGPANIKDAFLVKFTPSGTRLWGTYYGGTSYDEGICCRTDNVGNVYLSGGSLSPTGTLIATPGSHQPAYNGGTSYGDGFIAKFTSAGVRKWGTYYGDAGEDLIGDLELDTQGHIYFAGTAGAGSGTTIASTGAYQTVFAGGTSDVMFGVFDTSGVRQWASYYGGTGWDDWGFCTLTSTGDILLSGATDGPGNQLSTPCTYQDNFGGGPNEVFFAKFTNNGQRIWGSYYGGSSTEFPLFCETDNAGHLFIGGSTSTQGGTVMATPGSSQPLFGGGYGDAFLAKLNDCTPAVANNVTPASNLVVCEGRPAYLYTDASCGINWYASQTSTTSLGQGSAFVSTPLNVPTSFFVEAISCGSLTARTEIQVTTVPSPTVNASATTTIMCAGSPAVLTASGALVYTWSNGASGNPITVSPQQSITYTVTGSTNAGNCSDTAVVMLNVQACLSLNAYDLKSLFSVFPNPAHDAFMVNCGDLQEELSISLYTIAGEKILEQFFTGSATIDLSGRSKGLYIYSVKRKDIKVYSGKLAVE